MTRDQIRKCRKPGWLDVPDHAKDVKNMLGTAETLRKKFRRLKAEVDGPEGRDIGDYFGALGVAIIATVSGREYETAFDTACLYADLAGEQWWFLNRLAPIIKGNFNLL